MTDPDRLPTPDLLGDGYCVHAPANWGYCAVECSDCIELALSRARDDGIEAAASAIDAIAARDDDTHPIASSHVHHLAQIVRAIKEDRPR